MSATNRFHRPLVAGVQVMSAATVQGQLTTVSGGTLTGLATRNSDGKRVLVTNLHSIAADGHWERVNGNEELHQADLPANPFDYVPVPSRKVGRPLDWVPVAGNKDNIADVAICEILPRVDANFSLHNHPSHDERRIVGVVEPVEGMELTMLGAANGEGTVTVDEIDQTRRVRSGVVATFTGVIILDCSQRPFLAGDSGGPCLLQIDPYRYRLACITFGYAAGSGGREAWAFPASVAEEELGITFGVPKKEQLRDGINLASKHLLRSTGPTLRPNASTGVIEEDWDSVVAGQSVGDAPIVCVVPNTGSIAKGNPVTDRMGVTYTPVRLPGGLSAYKYFQPNNDHYATIVGSRLTHSRTSSPKRTRAQVRVKFIDKEQPAGSQDIMELEVRKITRWGPPLTAPEFEYQAKVNSYGTGFSSARAVFLPDRLIESTSWTTIWKSGSSKADLGPDFPQRAAAVPGLSPFTMLMSRMGAMTSSVPGLASRAVGINNFYARNNVTFELFEGLGGYFDTFDDDVHFIHSDAMFLPGAKTQTERPRYDWWWWPTRTGTSTARRLYTTVHWPWKEGARSIEALYYLFKHADTTPSGTESDDDGIRHCYEWLKRSGFDGWGLERLVLTGAVGDSNDWGEHTPFVRSSLGQVSQTAHSIPSLSKHLILPRGYHAIYWADHLLRFAIACGWLYPALRWQGDDARSKEVKGWLMKATDVLLSLQLPWNGIFVDDEGNEYCQPDVAGGLFSAYRVVDSVPRNCRYGSRLEEVATVAGSLFPGAQGQQGLVPSPHNSHYELSIGVILAFALAYHAVDDGQASTPANWPPVAYAGADQVVGKGSHRDAGRFGEHRPRRRLADILVGASSAGPSVTLSSTYSAASPTFDAPSSAAALTFKLTGDGQPGGVCASDTVTIRVVSRPAAPSNLRATAGDGQITLRWDDPNDASITRYKCRVRSGRDRWGSWRIIRGSGPATVEFVKAGLVNGTAYTVRVRAVNVSGNGAPAQVGPVRPTASRVNQVHTDEEDKRWEYQF